METLPEALSSMLVATSKADERARILACKCPCPTHTRVVVYGDRICCKANLF